MCGVGQLLDEISAGQKPKPPDAPPRHAYGRPLTCCSISARGDRVMRLTAQTAQFHAGAVHFRKDAPWLGELMAELLGFPGVRHDDQVDSVSQALAYIEWIESHRWYVRPLIV
jgi:hypothetical protein